MDSPLGILAFLGLFHVAGAIAMGWVLRRLLRGQFSLSMIGMFVWGIGFAGMPLIIGAFSFITREAYYFFALELLLILVTVLVTAFIPDWFLETFLAPSTRTALFGGLFIFVGFVAFVFMVQEDIGGALLFLLIFGGAGAFVLIQGIREAMKG